MPTTRTSRHDAIVVGARVAGAATAMLLARAGFAVLVVDRSRSGADTLSTHALMRGGVLQLHRWGLLDRSSPPARPPIRSPLRYGNERHLLDQAAHGVDALYAPRRTVLDPILVDAAVAAGAEVRYGVTVTGVLRDATAGSAASAAATRPARRSRTRPAGGRRRRPPLGRR